MMKEICHLEILLPFIFGDNSRNEEIGMTTPVVIKMNNNEMAFIMQIDII